MKLWAGRFQKQTDELVNDFNASISFDQRLYKQDITGSMAHAQMLCDCGILTAQDNEKIQQGLAELLAEIEAGTAWADLGLPELYGTVAVIGGGMVGCETAEYLAARGCKVSVIEMMDKIAAGESTTILPTLLENYKTYGVEQYPSHKVKEFRMDAVVCENKDGAEVTIPCDYIVLAMGARSNEFDAAALEAANIPVYAIGDAAGKAADISNAIRTGYDTACQL